MTFPSEPTGDTAIYLLVFSISCAVIWILHEVIVMVLIAYSNSYISIQEELDIDRDQIEQFKRAMGLIPNIVYRTFKGRQIRSEVQHAIREMRAEMDLLASPPASSAGASARQTPNDAEVHDVQSPRTVIVSEPSKEEGLEDENKDDEEDEDKEELSDSGNEAVTPEPVPPLSEKVSSTTSTSSTGTVSSRDLEKSNLEMLKKWGVVKSKSVEKKHKKKKKKKKKHVEGEETKVVDVPVEAIAGEPESMIERKLEVLGTTEVNQRIGKIKTVRLGEIKDAFQLDQKAARTVRSALLRSYVGQVKAIKSMNVRQLSGRTSVNYVKAIVQLLIAIYGADILIFVYLLQHPVLEFLHRLRLVFSVYCALTVFEIYNKEQFQLTYFLHHFSVILSCGMGISLSNEPLHPALFGYITCLNFTLGFFFALKGYRPEAKITRLMLGVAGYWYLISSSINLVGQAYIYIWKFDQSTFMRYVFPFSYLMFISDDIVLINYLIYQFKKNKIPPFARFKAVAYPGGTADMVKNLQEQHVEEELRHKDKLEEIKEE